jgi:hypothetical protein
VGGSWNCEIVCLVGETKLFSGKQRIDSKGSTTLSSRESFGLVLSPALHLRIAPLYRFTLDTFARFR